MRFLLYIEVTQSHHDHPYSETSLSDAPALKSGLNDRYTTTASDEEVGS